jgi:hypothetical protein
LSAKSRQLSVSSRFPCPCQADLRVIERNVEIVVSIDLWNSDNQVVLRQVVDALRVDGIVIGGQEALRESRVGQSSARH